MDQTVGGTVGGQWVEFGPDCWNEVESITSCNIITLDGPNGPIGPVGGGGGGSWDNNDTYDPDIEIPPTTQINLLNYISQAEYDWEELDQSDCRFTYNNKPDLSKSELFLEILIQKTKEQFGLQDVAAVISILAGSNLIATRAKLPGATSGTSLASKYLSSLVPYESPVRLPSITGFPRPFGAGLKLRFTKNVGRFLGRATPIVGWGILAYDLYSILHNTIDEYQGIVPTC